MDKKIKRIWKIQDNFHTQEFYLEDNFLLHKDWFDTSKNPNRNKYGFEDILLGKQDYNFLIVLNLRPWILREIKENINIIIKRNETK